jgi:chorismate dehydratase
LRNGRFEQGGSKGLQNATDGQFLPRLAASSYLNTAPLIWSFIEGVQRENIELHTHEAPARCADMLSSGEVEAALVPVIEYQRLSEVRVVPGVCVGSRRRVRSVVLATRNEDLRSVKSVALDTSSRTSAALIQVIFKEFMGISPRFLPAAPNLDAMLQGADAALIIGDPAMTFQQEGLIVHDMAALWRQHTGLGFVFAMWMIREQSLDILDRVDFAAARDEGLANVDTVLANYDRELNLPVDELRHYLTENISFSLDDEMKQGMELYFRLAHKHGLVPELQPIRFAGA